MSLRQYIIVFCLFVLVTLGNSYSMKYVVDRLNALETKIENSEKKCESESKLRRSETEELFRMISELANVKIPSRTEQVSQEENVAPSEQSATKSPSADKYTTTELATELNNLKSYIINGVAVEKQQNVKLRSELKSVSKQLEAENAMFESRLKEEIRNFTNDVSDKLTFLVSEERFNNLSDFVTTTMSELRNEARQSLFSLKNVFESSIQKLSNDFRTVNQTAMENVLRCNNISDSLTLAITTALSEERNETRQSLKSFKSDVKASIQEISNDVYAVNETLTNSIIYVKSCRNAPKSGYYYTNIAKSATQLRVYCDQETDGGGWLVIQRRKDGSVDFERNWADYKTGFGDIENEFWIGNDNIHDLTSSGLNELRIDMMDFGGNKAYAKYRYFKVHPESDLYKLQVDGYIGNASDSLEYHNGRPFSTKDRNDQSCSKYLRGAWWYTWCGFSNLNGYHGGNSPYPNGMFWYYWKKSYYSLKTVEMKIR